MEFDGHFFLDNGERINYRVDPNFHGEIYQHGELVKASRMICFYKLSGESSGCKPYFATIEKLTTILPNEVREVYLREDSYK